MFECVQYFTCFCLAFYISCWISWISCHFPSPKKCQKPKIYESFNNQLEGVFMGPPSPAPRTACKYSFQVCPWRFVFSFLSNRHRHRTSTGVFLDKMRWMKKSSQTKQEAERLWKIWQKILHSFEHLEIDTAGMWCIIKTLQNNGYWPY